LAQGSVSSLRPRAIAMRAVIAAAFPLAAAQLVDMNRALFAPAVNAPADYYGAQGRMQMNNEWFVQFEPPVLAYEEEAPEPGFGAGMPAVVAVLAVGALAGAMVGRGSDAAGAAAAAEEEADLEAALDAAHVLTLAGPLLADERKVAMLFGGGAATKKPAPKKAAPKKAAPKKVVAKKPAAKKPAPKRPVAAKKPAAKKPVAKKRGAPAKARGEGPNLQPAPGAIAGLRELFSLAAVGGAQGNTLSN